MSSSNSAGALLDLSDFDDGTITTPTASAAVSQTTSGSGVPPVAAADASAHPSQDDDIFSAGTTPTAQEEFQFEDFAADDYSDSTSERVQEEE